MIQAPIMNSKLAIFHLRKVTDALRRLVNLGDKVFGLVVTDLIRAHFPNLRVGPSSVSQISVLLIFL